MHRGWMFSFLVALIAIAPSVRAAEAGNITGRVIADDTGDDVSSAQIRILRLGEAMLTADIESAADGTFLASELKFGEYQIEVVKPGFVGTTLWVRLVPIPGNSDTFVTVRLIHCGVISGKVVDAMGRSIVGVTIYVSARSSAARRFDLGQATRTTTDDTGYYRVYNLPPGAYAVAASYRFSGENAIMTRASPGPFQGNGLIFYPDNRRPSVLELGQGEEQRNVDFTITQSEASDVVGSVQLPHPRARFLLALVLADQPAIALQTDATDSRGTFRFVDVAPGEYEILGTGPYLDPGTLGVSLDAEPLFVRAAITVGNGTLEGMSLNPRAAHFIKVRVLPVRSEDSSSCPSAGELVFTPQDNWATSALTLHIAATVGSEVVVGPLAPGRYRIGGRDLGSQCYMNESPEVDPREVDSNPVVVALAAAGSIQGRIDLGSRPGDGTWVVLWPPSLWSAGGAPQIAVPDGDGRFTLDRLRPGVYHIAARDSNDNGDSRRVVDMSGAMEVLVASGVNRVDLTLPDSKALGAGAR